MRSSSADDDDIGNLIDKSFFDYVGDELQIKVKILHQTHAKSDVVKKKPLLSYFFSVIGINQSNNQNIIINHRIIWNEEFIFFGLCLCLATKKKIANSL